MNRYFSSFQKSRGGGDDPPRKIRGGYTSPPPRPPPPGSPPMATCTHVFVRHVAVRKPLRPPYDGPFRIVSRTDKHFTLDLHGRHDTVSVDRLKVAHLDPATPPHPAPVTTPQPPATTATPTAASSSTSQPTTAPLDDPPGAPAFPLEGRFIGQKHLTDFVTY